MPGFLSKQKCRLMIFFFSLSLSQVIFEAEVSDSKAGFIAIDDIQVLSYPCGESLACQQLVLVG